MCLIKVNLLVKRNFDVIKMHDTTIKINIVVMFVFLKKEKLTAYLSPYSWLSVLFFFKIS
jgi:hypothetical protein